MLGQLHPAAKSLSTGGIVANKLVSTNTLWQICLDKRTHEWEQGRERERERGDRYAGRRLPIPKENENMAYWTSILSFSHIVWYYLKCLLF
jgi:hypothetical protein